MSSSFATGANFPAKSIGSTAMSSILIIMWPHNNLLGSPIASARLFYCSEVNTTLSGDSRYLLTIDFAYEVLHRVSPILPDGHWDSDCGAVPLEGASPPPTTPESRSFWKFQNGHVIRMGKKIFNLPPFE